MKQPKRKSAQHNERYSKKAVSTSSTVKALDPRGAHKDKGASHSRFRSIWRRANGKWTI